MRIELNIDDTETLQKLKDKAMMLKIICLDDLGKDPLFDVSRMNRREKVRLQVEVEKRWKEMPDSDIIEQFNEICIQTIFDTQGPEYEDLPVTSVGRPQLPKEEVERISLLPEEDQKKICGKVLKFHNDPELTIQSVE
jgi:hypothetical protein